jgi:hypothetical protein
MRSFRRSFLIATGLAATGAVTVLAASPAAAANSLDISGIGPTVVTAGYSCDARAGVVGLEVMVGDPSADKPSATGAQRAVTCDGAHHDATINLVGASPGEVPLRAGRKVQVRAALVDRNDTVISGQAKLATLG